jgi:Leucine-rich repeat (LRR) protein
LDCSNNELKVLDVSRNYALTTLWCRYNQLKKLKVGKNEKLTALNCCNNQLSAAALDKLFKHLPRKTPDDNAFISISNNPGENFCNKSIAENKGWRFV